MVVCVRGSILHWVQGLLPRMMAAFKVKGYVFRAGIQTVGPQTPKGFTLKNLHFYGLI